MSDSFQKEIPKARINLKLDLHTGGASKKTELPLKLLVGVRSWQALQAGKTADNCPHYAERLVKAWDLSCEWFDPFEGSKDECEAALHRLAEAREASVLLWGE